MTKQKLLLRIMTQRQHKRKTKDSKIRIVDIVNVNWSVDFQIHKTIAKLILRERRDRHPRIWKWYQENGGSWRSQHLELHCQVHMLSDI